MNYRWSGTVQVEADIVAPRSHEPRGCDSLYIKTEPWLLRHDLASRQGPGNIFGLELVPESRYVLVWIIVTGWLPVEGVRVVENFGDVGYRCSLLRRGSRYCRRL